MTAKTTRRAFLGGGVAAGGVLSGWFGAGLIEYMGAAPDTPWKSLTTEEAAIVDRLAEELIPADPPSSEFPEGIPGAHDAKVVRYIDWQLAKDAPYADQLPFYRAHLTKIAKLSAAEVERQFPKFFATLLTHVKQGFYGHPVHGGNFGWASYRMIGVAEPSFVGRNRPA